MGIADRAENLDRGCAVIHFAEKGEPTLIYCTQCNLMLKAGQIMGQRAEEDWMCAYVIHAKHNAPAQPGACYDEN